MKKKDLLKERQLRTIPKATIDMIHENKLIDNKKNNLKALISQRGGGQSIHSSSDVNHNPSLLPSWKSQSSMYTNNDYQDQVMRINKINFVKSKSSFLNTLQPINNLQDRYIYAYMYIHMYVYMYLCMYFYVYIYMYKYIHIYIYTYIYI
jgi:hypothetical protein